MRLAFALLLLAASTASAYLVPCTGADGTRIADAMRRIRASVDPCGGTAELTALLDRVARCRTAGYEICTSTTTDRNLYDRRVITWNPTLRTALDASTARDPVASLVHELVHAVDDCEGRNPGERELEAVRVENVYRRAAGLPQRTGYGDVAVPVAACEPAR
jgi:hypothetical protein